MRKNSGSARPYSNYGFELSAIELQAIELQAMTFGL
jgi:hypothetical protein